MKLKLVVVDLELSRRQRLLGAAGLGAAILMVGAVAVADVPNTFVAGDTLTAAGLNENFDDIDTRVSGLDQELVQTNAALDAAEGDLNASFDDIDTRVAAVEQSALSVFGSELNTTDDPAVVDWQSFAVTCMLSNPAGALNYACALAAQRKCLGLGYQAGWFVGENGSSGIGNTRTIVCIG